MVRLIDDLLDLSRISRSTLGIRKERVEPAAVLEITLESSRPLIEKSGLELTVSLPTESVQLNADPIRLAQVFPMTDAFRWKRGSTFMSSSR